MSSILNPIGGTSGGGGGTVNRQIQVFVATAGQTVFSIASTPPASNLDVHLNGALVNEGASNDYTYTPGTITFNYGLVAGDIVTATYFV